MKRRLMATALAFGCAMTAFAQDPPAGPPPDVAAAVNWHGRPSEAQQQAVMRQFLSAHQHADDLLWPMLVQGAQRHLCPQTAGAVGFRFLDVPHPPESNSTGKALGIASTVSSLTTRGGLIFGGVGLAANGVATLFHRDRDPGKVLGIVFGATIDHLAPGTPAALAGLQESDRIMAIDGQALEPGKSDSAGRSNARLEQAAQAALAAGKPVHFDVQRAGQPLAIDVTPARVCAVEIRDVAMAGPFDSASADTNHLVVDVRLMNETDTDAQRQIVLSHLLAHTLLLQLRGAAATQAQATEQTASALAVEHSSVLAVSPTLTAIPAGEWIAIATNAFTNATSQEIAADRLSLVLAQSIGIAPADVEAFWTDERADHAHPWFESHRPTPERLAALRIAAQHAGAESADTAKASVAPPSAGTSTQ